MDIHLAHTEWNSFVAISKYEMIKELEPDQFDIWYEWPVQSLEGHIYRSDFTQQPWRFWLADVSIAFATQWIGS